jgi:hypothetical protein
MKLWDLLTNTMYDQPFDVYITNDYDQNIQILAGTRDELRADPDIFDALMLEVEIFYIMKDYSLVVLLKSEKYDESIESMYSTDYVKKWKRDDPESRPYRFMSEINTLHGGHCCES